MEKQESKANLESLARRAVAYGWRFPRGSRTMAGNLSLTDKCDGEHAIFLRASPFDELRAASAPDLSDPATLGCLLALVREKHGAPSLAPIRQHGHVWAFWRGPDALRSVTAATEVELLVAALEVPRG